MNTRSEIQDERESEAGLQPPLQHSAPFGELPPAEPELFEAARVAVRRLRGRGRRLNGQAGVGNTLRLKTGLRSAQLLEQPDIATWHREQVAAITADLGGEQELSALKRAAVREAARLEVICAALGHNLLQHGVLTGKGKTRAATLVYLHVFDRLLRASQLLRLDRKDGASDGPTPAPVQLYIPRNGRERREQTDDPDR